MVENFRKWFKKCQSIPSQRGPTHVKNCIINGLKLPKWPTLQTLRFQNGQKPPTMAQKFKKKETKTFKQVIKREKWVQKGSKLSKGVFWKKFKKGPKLSKVATKMP